ncbi:MAG: nickel-dependent lactate racemase [Dictyoglomaceae bacterium]
MDILFEVDEMKESVNIPEENLISIIEPKKVKSWGKEEVLIEKALDNPIGSEKIEDMLNFDSKVSIVVDDITRPTPTSLLLNIILKKLKNLGVKEENIKITIGNGLHRKTTYSEKEKILGRDILGSFDVQDNDPLNKENFEYLGETSLGTPIYINKRALWGDLIIATGIIKSHAFAGFTGGAKSLIPGVAHKDTILKNHSFDNIDYPKGLLGDVESIPRKDMEEAVKKLSIPLYILNVVLDLNGNVFAAFSGDFILAHREGVKTFKNLAEIYINERADLVIVESSYTSGFNLYQTLFGGAVTMLTRFPIVKEGGMVVLFSPCKEGIGAKIIEDLVPKFSSGEEILEYLKHSSPKEEQWAVQHLAYFLTHGEIGLVTRGISEEDVKRLKMKYFENLKNAISYAFNKYGENIRILIIKKPDFVIPLYNPQKGGDERF